MNICMFGASFLPRRGGMEFVIHHLANALVHQGHHVSVIAERTAWQDIGVDHDYDLVRYGIPTRGIRRLGLAGPESLWAIWRKHSKAPFDILHCHGVSHAGSRAAWAKRIFGIPVVMTPHGEDIQRVPEINYGLRLDSKWDARICKNLNCADAVTAISMSVENELDCIDGAKVIRIPNGVHVNAFGMRESQFLRDRLGIDNDQVLVLSVGRNHVKKGYDYGIKAFAALHERFGVSNAHYVIVGKKVGEHAGLVSQLSLSDTVTLLDELGPAEVTECYHSADIFFSPSIIEGLSLVSIEALACGLPLLVTDVPGNEDIVRDTGAGVIVRSKDPDNMAQGLYDLICDADKRVALSKTALERAGDYDWHAIAASYAIVYRNVLAGCAVNTGL